MSKLLALLLLFAGAFATAQEITVAAAADMSAALPQLVASYAKKTGQAVKLSFGSSGNLTNQIRNVSLSALCEADCGNGHLPQR